MPSSPQSESDDVTACQVLLAGTALADTVEILEVEVQRAVGQLPSARVILADGNMLDGDWPLANSDTCLPGTEIEIQAGYGDSLATIFKGLIVRMGVSIGDENTSRLTLDCCDKAVAMTLTRRHEVYPDQTDSAAIQTLIGRAGLSAAVASTAFTHESLVQFNCSDWDFVLARAEANGLLVIAEDGTLHVQAPALDGDPGLKVDWGRDLYAFDAQLDARQQPATVTTAAWDPATQAVQTGSSAFPVATPGLGNLSGSAIAAQLGANTARRLQAGSAVDRALLSVWGQAEQIKAALARVRGTARFQGSALAKVGGLLQVAGVGERFAGNLLIGRLAHRIADGQWTTEVGFGLDPQWRCADPDVIASPHGARPPGVAGLQVGVVLKLDGDPAGGQRIQIKLPVIEGSAHTLWARLLQPYASNGFGFFVLPEVGDEVLVGFFDQDPGSPIVLGSVHSSQHEPPFPISAANDTKALVTRARHRLEFDEKDKVITLTTPGANKIVLDDKDGSILLEDQHGNRVELNASGILLDSPGDIVLNAKGKVDISAAGDVRLSSSGGDFHASALDIACEAQIGFTAKGGATAELSAADQTTVKGAIVMIN
jgi:Rhs element Vgr protein